MPQPAPTISLTDTIAAIAAAISFIALFVGLYAASVSRQVESSGFQAVEKVKLETATFIAVLRSLMVKGALYTQQDQHRRDDPAFEAYLDIEPEQKAILEFMHSPTALAYYSFVAKKSKEARESGKKQEEWRVFFLQLGQLQQTKNPWSAARVAARLERQFDGLAEADFREIASNLDNLPKAIELLFSEREHDVLTYVLVEKEIDDGPLSDDHFIDFVQFLRKDKSIDDPELDVFWAAASGDTQLLESAHQRGANLQITSGALIKRYQQWVPEFKHRLAEASEPV